MAVPFSNTKLRVPRGFQNILEGLAREVLRAQPTDIQVFSAAYFERLLKVRAESGIDPAVHGAQLEDRFYNNKAFEKPDIDASSHEQQDAAVAIQTKYRQHHASQVVQDKREDKAAIKIQAGFRGYQDRCKVKQLKEARTSTGGRETEEEVDIDLEDPEVEAAAFKIQAGFKNYKSRKSSKPSEEEPAAAAAEEEKIDIDLEDPEVQKAATKIQAGFKGYKARKDADILKTTPVEEAGGIPSEPQGEGAPPGEEAGDIAPIEPQEKATPEVEEIDIDLNDPEVEQAAIKIQAGFKGFKARKAEKEQLTEEEAAPPVEEAGDISPSVPLEDGAAVDVAAQPEEEVIDIDLNDPEVEKAANKIQAGFKGFMARKQLQEPAPSVEEAGDIASTEPQEEAAAQPEEEIIDIDLNDPDVEKAANKIQAGFKSFMARKQLQKSAPPVEETGDIAPNVPEEDGTAVDAAAPSVEEAGGVVPNDSVEDGAAA